MKDYRKVIKERYDRQRYDGRGIRNNMYAPINPVGFYGEFKSAQILAMFVSLVDRLSGRSLDELKICDCGCGDGIKTRFMAELLGNPGQIYGIEYSKTRLQHCRNMNSSICYEYADMTKEIPFKIPFDAMTAFVVFMHFSTEKEIEDALKNIYSSLKKKGFFLWYELDARSHWDGKRKNMDHWGFSVEEMDKYASKAGFKLFRQFKIYTQVPVFNKPTLYMAKDVNKVWLLELMEMLPLKKNNNIRIYRKE